MVPNERRAQLQISRQVQKTLTTQRRKIMVLGAPLAIHGDPHLRLRHLVLERIHGRLAVRPVLEVVRRLEHIHNQTRHSELAVHIVALARNLECNRINKRILFQQQTGLHIVRQMHKHFEHILHLERIRGAQQIAHLHNIVAHLGRPQIVARETRKHTLGSLRRRRVGGKHILQRISDRVLELRRLFLHRAAARHLGASGIRVRKHNINSIRVVVRFARRRRRSREPRGRRRCRRLRRGRMRNHGRRPARRRGLDLALAALGRGRRAGFCFLNALRRRRNKGCSRAGRMRGLGCHDWWRRASRWRWRCSWCGCWCGCRRCSRCRCRFGRDRPEHRHGARRQLLLWRLSSGLLRGSGLRRQLFV
eukprot:comp14317_c0_seq1/m.20572 comp14317_c0_seq1/g.20572  ORF comp14317_c0_seq1/g.20572 comp14317_c0_seq1/m.20572 type:complete len:363 (+) comp14317_c0_seq1:561-1649(+)